MIPPELGNCRRLEHLNLSTLFLSGEIPPSHAQCRRLKTLVLRQNDLSGPIPDALGDLHDLEDIDLSENSPDRSRTVSGQTKPFWTFGAYWSGGFRA